MITFAFELPIALITPISWRRSRTTIIIERSTMTAPATDAPITPASANEEMLVSEDTLVAACSTSLVISASSPRDALSDVTAALTLSLLSTVAIILLTYISPIPTLILLLDEFWR